MQQVSKVILFFTRWKICRSREASAQIRRVKKRECVVKMHDRSETFVLHTGKSEYCKLPLIGARGGG
jgi:hypothetical protein